MSIAMCKFCGQVVALEKVPDDSQEAIEQATLRCESEEAQQYQNRVEYFKRAKKTIKKEFEEDYLKELFLEISQLIYDGKIYSFTLKIDGENTVKISQDSKGKIFVTKLFSTGNKIQL